MKKIQVLLSSYNGEDYIKEQIESILRQKNVDIMILIRDDGSTDNTVNIVKKIANEDNRIKYYVGDNIGPCNSFFELIKLADNKADYIAFADQDDVWFPIKIEQAISKLELYDDVMALYCGSYIPTNNNLEFLNKKREIERTPSFGNSLIECIYSGCTGVINKKLLLFLKKNIPNSAYMHDWWIYMVASAFGVVITDRKPLMYYRQHDSNVVGMSDNTIGKWKKRIKNYKKMKKYVVEQVNEFYEIYADKLTQEQVGMIECITMKNKNLFQRMKIFQIKEIKRMVWLDGLFYKLSFLIWGE